VEQEKAACSPAIIRFSSLRGSAMMAVPSEARQILELSSALDAELGPVRPRRTAPGSGRTSAVNESRSHDGVRVLAASSGSSAAEPRAEIEGHVMVEKLPHERGAAVCVDCWKLLSLSRRSASAPRASGSGVEHPVAPADVEQRFGQALARLRERRQPREHPAEAVLAHEEARAAGSLAEGFAYAQEAGAAERKRRRAKRAEEPATGKRSTAVLHFHLLPPVLSPTQ
jgi:hypothetical protein